MRLLPLAAVHHFFQVLHGIPDVDKSCVQRRQAKSQNVGLAFAIARPEITNHTSCNQGLHNGISAFTSSQADL